MAESNFKDSEEFNSKSSNYLVSTDSEEFTYAKSSGYCSGSPSSSRNSTKDENIQQTTTKGNKKKVVQKGRIVSSRYKTASLSVTSRMRTTNLQNLDITQRNSGGRCNSPLRISAKSGISASCMHINEGRNSSTDRTKGLENMKIPSSKTKNQTGLGPNLHSTAVNATLLDSTRSYSKTYSTTVIKPKRNAHNFAIRMPDISAIQPFIVAESTSPLVLTNNLLKEDSDDECHRVTQDDLDLEYLRYLTWAYVDASSEEAFQYQCSDAERQISFLMKIIKEKRDKITEHEKYLMLVKLHKQVSEQHEKLMELLNKFSELTIPCKNAIEEIGKSLQPKIDQIKLKNIYIPEDKKKYKDELEEVLLETNGILRKIEKNLYPREKDLNSINAAINCLKQKRDILSTCKRKADKIAGFAIQEASLNLTIIDLENKL